MVDKEDKNNVELSEDIEDSTSDTSSSSSSRPPEEEFPDSVPAVSMDKKKNTIIFIIGGLVVLYLVYSILNQPSKKPVVVTDLQEMKGAKGGSIAKGGAVAGGQGESTTSASAALPGASKEVVPEMFTNLDEKNKQVNLQEALPPPPTLPPVFDPASIYVKGEDSVAMGSYSSRGTAPTSLGTFGEKYTKKRTRLPELSTGLPEEGEFDGLDPEARKALEAERKKKINASMFVGGMKGGGATAAKKQKSGGTGAGLGNKNVVEEYQIGETGAGRIDVSLRKDLEKVILQGKVLDAVLETAINTDLPGNLRAIVSRDVYSESGKRVVIPKGSRLIGKYSTEAKFGQARVYVIWNRVIRPDGVDAIFGGDDMAAVDALGRTGVYGDLDNRFFEIFGSSILLSSLTVGFAVAADAAVGGDSTTTTTTPTGVGAGTSTTSGDIVSQGVSKAVTDLGNDVSSIAKQYFKTAPRITVDQGTRIKVFVNKDIIFPPSYFTVGGYRLRGTTQFID